MVERKICKSRLALPPLACNGLVACVQSYGDSGVAWLARLLSSLVVTSKLKVVSSTTPKENYRIKLNIEKCLFIYLFVSLKTGKTSFL